MAYDYDGRPLRIGIPTKDFHLSGAVDLLSLIIQGLALRRRHRLFLLMECDSTPGATGTADQPRPRSRATAPELCGPRRMACVKRATGWLRLPTLYRAMRQRVLLRRRAESVYGPATRGMTLVPVDSAPGSLEQAAATHRLDVVLPVLSVLTVPFVGYLYDCQHKYYPDHFAPDEPALRDKGFRMLLEGARALIVNSHDAKQDLMKFYDADPEVVFALPCTPLAGPDALRHRPELLRPYRLPPRYFLVSNQFWMHKSLETALQALRHLLDDGLMDCQLVFTGKMEEPRCPGYIRGFMQVVKDLHLQEATRFLGYIPKRDQLEIMKNAVAVIQPTLFEGGPGGGSVYNALALGVRCIVSDIPVNRELPVDRTVLFFQQRNARDLADKMRRFWQQSDYRRPDNDELLNVETCRMHGFSDVLYHAIGRAVQKHGSNSS